MSRMRKREVVLGKADRELADLITMERLIRNFLFVYSRPSQGHDPLRAAMEHVIEERVLLTAALAGDADALRARRVNDGAADALGK